VEEPRPVEAEAVAACSLGHFIAAMLPDRAAGECPLRTLPHLPFKWVNHKSRFDRITEDSDEWLLLL